MKLVLENSGYTVLTAYDPASGTSKVENERPDLLILDVMFGSNESVKGFDILVGLRKNNELSTIPVLMITSVNINMPDTDYSLEIDREYAPADDFIMKPAQPAELLKKVKELLEVKTNRRAF